MSKGRGEKIGIKFTEDLVGDIVGNEDAFIIEGKEREHINGKLIDGEYEVQSIEKKGIIETLITDENGEVEFFIDEGLSVDVRNLDWSVSAQGFITAQGTETDLTDETVINIILEQNLLPDIGGLVLWLDATDGATIESISNPVVNTEGLVLYLSADEGVHE